MSPPVMPWDRFKKYLIPRPPSGGGPGHKPHSFPGRLSRPDGEAGCRQAFIDMADLERGAIANPDENRMVGHYWLPAPALGAHGGNSPGDRRDTGGHQGFRSPGSRRLDRRPPRAVPAPARDRHRWIRPRPAVRQPCLGPAGVRTGGGLLRQYRSGRMDAVSGGLVARLLETLAIVISKSGGTIETRNGQLEAAAAFAPLASIRPCGTLSP